jgi:hypothetical protein
MKVQFNGSPDADDVADAFILAFVASRKGSPVSARQTWKSLQTRGFFPTDGSSTPHPDSDEGVAVAEIGQRLQKLFEQGVVGGDAEPESVTGDRHYWVLGHSGGHR